MRVEKEKAAALQKLEKRLARKEKLERLEAAESLEEMERIRAATIQVRVICRVEPATSRSPSPHDARPCAAHSAATHTCLPSHQTEHSASGWRSMVWWDKAAFCEARSSA